MSTYTVRDDAGTEHEVDEENLHLAERDGFLPVVSNGKEQHRVSAADLPLAEKDGFVPVTDTSLASRAMAGAKGLARGFSGDLADEAYGVVGAVVNPTDSDKDFVDRYRDSRDYARRQDKKDDIQHPEITTTARVAGGVGTGILTGGVGNTLGGSVAFGAAQGLGGSEADLTKPTLENLAQAGLDTAAGGTMGAAGYGAGKVIEKGIEGAGTLASQAGSKVDDAMQYLRTIGRAAKSGAKEASEDVPNVLGVKELAAAKGAIQGAISEMRETGIAQKEFQGIADQAREVLEQQVTSGLKVKRLQDLGSLQKIQAVGNGKSLADFSDDEAVVAALMTDGDNPIKRWFATKAATIHPGQIDADQYGNLLGESSGARIAAREFDPKEAARALKQPVEEAQGLFKGARDARFQQLQNAAQETFDSHGASSVLDDVAGAAEDAASMKSIPGSVRDTINDVNRMLREGDGAKALKLTKGAWDDADPAERFTRLQKARQFLDQQMNWAKREGLGQAELILRSVRGSIDDALKTSPEKVEADALYQASKQLEARFFGATEFRDAAGNIDIDEGKLARLLGNTDQANRFKAALIDLKQFAKRDDLPGAFKESAQNLAADIEEKMAKAELKRGIGAFRFANGPSSPAIERLSSASKGNTFLQDAVQSPAGFLSQADQFNKLVRERLGKDFSALEPAEKSAAVKFMVWMKNNPDASQQTADGVWKRLFEASK